MIGKIGNGMRGKERREEMSLEEAVEWSKKSKGGEIRKWEERKVKERKLKGKRGKERKVTMCKDRKWGG